MVVATMPIPAVCLHILCAVTLVSAVPASVSDCSVEDMLHRNCNTIGIKRPRVEETMDGGLSAEANLSHEEKAKFETLFARALYRTSAAQDGLHEFARRLYRLITRNGENEEVLQQAFYPCGQFDPKTISGVTAANRLKEKLLGGSLREIAGPVYCLTKNVRWLNETFHTLNRSFVESEFGAAAWDAIRTKDAFVQATAQENAKLHQSDEEVQEWGFPTHLYPRFESWVRLTFPNLDKRLSPDTWDACRISNGIVSLGLMSDSEEIYPPLSEAELEFQCGSRRPCKLAWNNFSLSYTLQDAKIGNHTSYLKRAQGLGYLTRAGPSQAMWNILQISEFLGFTPEDMVALRAAICAVFVVRQDHAILEIMLGADPFMPQEFKMVFGLKDFERFWPRGMNVQTSWGQLLKSSDIWDIVATELRENGDGLMQKMPKEVQCLIDVNATDCGTVEMPVAMDWETIKVPKAIGYILISVAAIALIVGLYYLPSARRFFKNPMFEHAHDSFHLMI